MDAAKLDPILNKESILKTASARELVQAAQDVLQRYATYALTHVPLGDTTKQKANLERVVVENKTCAVGSIVGPYGYGKTSTAVHLWSELRNQKIVSVPPFLWVNLPELMDAVYYWIRFEFSLGPKAYLPALDEAYSKHRLSYVEELNERLGCEVVQELLEAGRLVLDIRPEDVVGFFSDACEVCEHAGYHGLAIFTDELQATLAAYRPSRDQFFAHLFEIVRDILGRPGHWALVMTMDDDTEGTISRLRLDLLQRLQKSALYFRVRDVYNRREYPAELWSAFEQRFGFDGSEVILSEALESIGQVAARMDLGAGPRMVTNALSMAVKSYSRTQTAYTPIQFVDDFLAGQMSFDQRGKFGTAVKRALDNPEVRASADNERVVKLLAAYPMGCSEQVLVRFDLLTVFRAFPPLARRELFLQQSGGYIVRYLAEDETPPEQIEQRLTKEFVGRFSPGKSYAERAAEGFRTQVLLDPTFSNWKAERHLAVKIGDVAYQADFLRGTFDARYPDRLVAVLVAAVPQSAAPVWEKPHADADIELRFELNYAVAAAEPSRLLVSPSCPNVAVFQLNIATILPDAANKILPSFLHDYYSVEQLTPLLSLALVEHLFRNRGDLPDDRNRVSAVISPLRQYALTVLMSERLETLPVDYASNMVGTERVKDLFKQLCKRLYPSYRTFVTSSKWKENLQQYRYALERVIADDGISIARGRRSWRATKEQVADAFQIPGRRLVNLEPLLDALNELITKEEFSGRLPTSEVSLRFQMHPLEQEWLSQLDSSRERAHYNGNQVPALPAEHLMRQAKTAGYTDAEIGEVIRLLQTRKFVDLDARKNLFVRTVDAIDDLREAVAEQISNLEKLVRELSESLPDFDTGRYPFSRLRAALEDARERDEIEMVKAEVRQLASGASSFAASRASALREKLQQEQNRLLEMLSQGVPAWLGREFTSGPLREPLEKQRQDLVTAYQAALSDVRQLREESVRTAQENGGSVSQVIARTQQMLVDLSRKSRMLSTRLQSFEDRREDMEGWRHVAALGNEVVAKAEIAQSVYANSDFQAEAERLWKTLRGQFETQALTMWSMHASVGKQIEGVRKRIDDWLNGRRQDFERRCEEYGQALAGAGISVDIRIPFDQEHPTESYDTLSDTVKRYVLEHLVSLARRLENSQQMLRYAIQIQRLPLTSAESHATVLIQRVSQLREVLADSEATEIKDFNLRILQPIVALATDSRKLADETQQAIRPRLAEGSEARLLSMITSAPGGQVDLRAIAIQLMDQGNHQVDLDAIVKDLESLFQKNQIAISISLLHRQG